MRHFGTTALVASAFALIACGGGEKKADTTVATTDSAAAPAAAATTPAATATAAPITGTTHEVKMMVDAKGSYVFEPSAITINAGDGIKYVIVSGQPHNVALDTTSITDASVKAQLAANMPEQASPFTSKILSAPNESYTISFANVKPGTYEVYCPLHVAMNMKQTVTVK